MREEVKKLAQMGPMPAMDIEDSTIDDILNQYGDLLVSIVPPVSDEEAKELLKLFGPDDAGEMVWTITHLVETAPSWPIKDYLLSLPESYWIENLKQRAINAGIWDE
jgi:hypothetical protein